MGHVYDDTTVRVTPEDHQKMHRDEKEVGPIGSLARQDIRKPCGVTRKTNLFKWTRPDNHCCVRETMTEAVAKLESVPSS